jgi:hypothetical protein
VRNECVEASLCGPQVSRRSEMTARNELTHHDSDEFFHSRLNQSRSVELGNRRKVLESVASSVCVLVERNVRSGGGSLRGRRHGEKFPKTKKKPTGTGRILNSPRVVLGMSRKARE